MQAHQFKASAGFSWLSQTLKICIRNFLFILAWTLTSLVLNSLPFALFGLNELFASLVYFFSLAFFLLGFNHILKKQPKNVASIFAPLNKQKLLSLLLAALIAAALALINALLAGQLIDVQAISHLTEVQANFSSDAASSDSQALQSELTSAMSQINIFSVMVFMTLFYFSNVYIILMTMMVLETKLPVSKALFNAFIGLKRNLLPFIVTWIGFFGLMIVGTIVFSITMPLFAVLHLELIWLIVYLSLFYAISQGSICMAYRKIFSNESSIVESPAAPKP